MNLFKKYLLHIIKFKNICVFKTILLFTSNKIVIADKIPKETRQQKGLGGQKEKH